MVLVIAMMRVKVFDEEQEDDLSDVINDFLEDNDDIHVYDIKFATAVCKDEDELAYCFSALLIYQEN